MPPTKAGNRVELPPGHHRLRWCGGYPRPVRHWRSGGIDDAAKHGSLSLSLGACWAKSLSFTTGPCPALKYNRQLMMATVHDKVQVAKAVNAKAIPQEEAPRGYAEFDAGPQPSLF